MAEIHNILSIFSFGLLVRAHPTNKTTKKAIERLTALSLITYTEGQYFPTRKGQLLIEKMSQALQAEMELMELTNEVSLKPGSNFRVTPSANTGKPPLNQSIRVQLLD